MIVDSVTVGPFEENCYLIVDERSRDAVLIDPGDDGDRIVALVARHGVTPTAVWLTHAHLDHIGAVSAVRREWPGIPVFLHPLDAPVYSFAAVAAKKYGIPFEQPDAADRTLAEGDVLTLGVSQFTVWHVPGHAPGHVAFMTDGVVFGGDCIFAGSVGRTDLPLCSPGDFVRSLERLLGLADATVVRPGHGPPTTIGRERTSNPFLTGELRVPGTARAVAPVPLGQ
ncbi:MAG: MBL fold metallo-hydrolase [Gemmatimonadetes bacterium]|nr:MBL fold metallo-hydrolase [Gemmatimonadota bacterium]